MYLKSIEIQGFKSFADRVLLEFHSGITAIVGPNGSGKSNVADAVRWVLGEQSAKQLRGTRMEDVIFAGTQLRKKLGFAYVAITFDNSDHKLVTPYDEVKVARRVYRSGESEYLFNGSVCRLRDVQELFLDTGIGQEGYSIIGQGQIEKILSGRPEERRELFDEAAGIAKFKKRKQDALRNLEEEQKNLARMEDILAELERQVVPLEQQAKKAQEFLRYREELKTQEMKQFLLESDSVQKELDMLEEKLFTAKDDYQRAEDTFENIKKTYDLLEQKQQEQKQLFTKQQRELSEAKVEKEKHEGSCKVLEEKKLALKQRVDTYASRKAALLSQTAQQEKEIAGHHRKIESLTKEQEVMAVKNQEVSERMSVLRDETEKRQDASREYMEHIYEEMKERAALKANVERYQTMLDQNSLKKAELKKQLLLQKSKDAVIDEELLEKQKMAETTGQTEKLLLETKAAMTQEHKKKSEEIEKLSLDIEEKQTSFHREYSKLESLRNLTERYDGFGSSIKRVMEQKHSGVLGVVSDVIRVKKQYEAAVEAALGSSIQHIVTDTEDTAKQMISFLKQHKYGRATFLPLTGIFAKTDHREDVLHETGVIGYANTLAKTEKRFTDLVDFLLARTLVVDTIDHAVQIARKYRQSVRMVTLDGEVINVGGAMSGGAFRHVGSLLGRRREVEELEKKTKRISEDMASLRKELEELRRQSNLYAEEFTRIDQKLQKNSLEKNTLQMQIEQLLGKKQELAEAFRATKEEDHTLAAQSMDLEKAMKDCKEEIETSEQKETAMRVKMEQEKTDIAEKTNYLQKISLEAEQMRIKQAALRQEITFEREYIVRLEEEKEQKQKELAQLLEEAAGFGEEERMICEQVQKERLLAQKQEEQIAVAEQENIRLLRQQEKTTEQVKQTIVRREELQRQLTGLDKECYRLHTQKEAVEARQEEMAGYMWKEYQLTRGQIEDILDTPKESLKEIKKNVQKLKELKMLLGDVNVNAIEDYRNVSDRYSLLKGQYDDVTAAEKALLDIIDDLDRQMREQFKEKFEEIQAQFDVVFKELFGGGQGTLELTDSADVLQAGIRIHAQPPGKRLQNMMQLSGGEKSLTAIALLFAIQNLKPSPFCLLDEIEAALDDANVKRYAKYLHKLTKDTQFLVITHRRGTMTAADVLYGITMQEKGVSAMVSVSLVEEQLT